MNKTHDIWYPNYRRLIQLLVFVLVLAHQLPVQGETVDSLYHIYMNADKKQKAKIVNQISQVMYDDEILDTLYNCSTSTKDKLIDATLHYLMAEHFFDSGQFELALSEGNKAYELIERGQDNQFKSNVLGVVSNTQFRLAAYDKALKTLLIAYQLDKKLDKKEYISSDLNLLSAIYLAIKRPEPGIKYIEKAIDIERSLKRMDRLAMRLGMASELYLMNNEPEKALKAINEAYQIDYQAGKDEKAAVRLTQKGAIFQKTGQLEEAQKYMLKALPVLEGANILYSLAVTYNQLGDINLKLGKKEAAVQYFKKALAVSIQCGTPMVESNAERGLWETLRDDNPAVAMIHLERYSELSDSLSTTLEAAHIKGLDFAISQVELSANGKKPHDYKQIFIWAAGLISLLMLFAAISLYIAWKRNKSALQMQKQTQEIRSNFFTNITNELQAPLTVIMSAGHQLKETRKANAEENRLIGDMIVNHGTNMLGLVNQLIDIQNVKSDINQAQTKQGDIVMYVRMLVDNFYNEAHEHLVSLDFVCDMKSKIVLFMPEYIHNIVHTLVSNAFKFTPRNGNIKVELIALDGNNMRLIVADTGKGIPNQEREHIFEPLSQGNSDDDEGSDTVLGLSLVNQLVQSMRGTIVVESEEGKGTKFTIDFPVQTIEGNSQANENAPRRAEDLLNQIADGKNKPMVFIVENNEDVAFFIANHLRGQYNLRLAHDGLEALQNAQNMVPDLIITNMVMPAMDGWELIKRVRASSTLNHIPIIALTSDTSEQERIACFEAGADNVLVKPFNSSELRIVASKLISQRSKLRERYTETLSSITADTPATQMTKEDQDFLNKLVDIIHAQMAKDDIDMEHIAAALSLSRKQLRTRVMNITGLTPVAYVLQIRLNYARRMITSEDTSLTTIASRCGFQNLSHFSKAFKQQFGVSPMQFRKNMDNVPNSTAKT